MIIRNFARSHFESDDADADAAAVTSFARAARVLPIASSANASSRPKARPPGAAPTEELLRPPCAKAYSAAAIRGGPTKPAGSPNRSIITAVRSLVLLVTQAPERTV